MQSFRSYFNPFSLNSHDKSSEGFIAFSSALDRCNEAIEDGLGDAIATFRLSLAYFDGQK
jgi:hypothetical protein